MQKRIQSPGLSVAFSADEIERARRENKLLSMDIELTSLCNISCIYCYAESGQKSADELGLDEVIDIIDQAKELGLRTLTLTGGEPLLDERYFTIARYAVERGLAVMLFTNGTLVTRELAERIFELRISPCVKLDSLSPATQDYLAGRKGTLEKIRESINNLISVGYTTKHPVLAVNAVVLRENRHEIPEWWHWARKQNITPFLTRLQLMGRASDRTDLTVTPEELYELYGELARIDEGFGISWEPGIPWVYGKACRKHHFGCFITAQGNVQPCSGIPIRAGNIREQSLRDILSNSQIFRVSRNIEDYIEGACKACQHRTECYGCRSVAYFASGSFTAADPLCWHNRPEGAVTPTLDMKDGIISATNYDPTA